MAEREGGWSQRGAWAGHLSAGRHGAAEGEAGLTVEPLEGLDAATLLAAPGRGAALADALRSAFGVAPPERPEIAQGADLSLVWSGPGHWLALSPRPGLAGRLTAAAGDLAAVAGQGASRGLLRLSGPVVREVLARGCMLDLHPRAFPVGAAALTVIAHVNVQLWRPDETGFVLAVPRSFAGSLWSWLREAAAADGCTVVAPRAA